MSIPAEIKIVWRFILMMDKKTWERGQSVSGWSSEAVVTEANGKLYMFTRHGGYYVSSDFGKTWSDRGRIWGFSIVRHVS